MKYLFLSLVLLGSVPATACQFDTDCSVGSQCIKQGYSLNGVCMGGLNPGNNNDRKPVYNQLNPRDKTGNTCSFDTDCGIGLTCHKSGYSIKGTCY